jgi:threonine dehydrogenase-like Zn-dependent dehydrogenase
MRGVALDYESRKLICADIPDPGPPGPGQVLLRVREVGVCGTDRELTRFSFGYPPEGESRLILGHEALAEVVEAGSGVSGIRPGDWVVPTVRRSCRPPCAQCAAGRRDLCLRAANPERGIFGLHGYFTDYALDAAADLVPVPPDALDNAVLVEPLSVVEKAIASALRCHPGTPVSFLAIGAGTIGILGALAAQVRGLRAVVHSLEPPGHPRVRLLELAGIEYRTSLDGVQSDIILEAAGSPEAAFRAIRALAPLGVLVVLGALSASGDFPFMDLIIGNRTVLGSVNAGPDAFRSAVADLRRFDAALVAPLVERRPFTGSLDGLLEAPARAAKLVHVLER